jgi:hypothetical protein
MLDGEAAERVQDAKPRVLREVGSLPSRSRCARRSQLPLQAAILAGAYPGFLDGVGRYFKSEKHSPRPHARPSGLR